MWQHLEALVSCTCGRRNIKRCRSDSDAAPDVVVFLEVEPKTFRVSTLALREPIPDDVPCSSEDTLEGENLFFIALVIFDTPFSREQGTRKELYFSFQPHSHLHTRTFNPHPSPLFLSAHFLDQPFTHL